MIILGITGTNGAGKGTVVEYLKSRGFVHLSVSDYLKTEIQMRNLPINRDSMVLVANELREKYGPDYLVQQLYQQAEALGKNAIIESIRTVGEVNFLRTKENFKLVGVDAEPKLRFERIAKRGSEKDNIDLQKFLADEEREYANTDPTKANIKRCMELADIKLNNDGSVDELFAQIEKVFL